MRRLILLLLVACKTVLPPLPPEGEFTTVSVNYCSTFERVCPDGGCCPEDDVCGGTPGCPPNACCYTGKHWWDNLPHYRIGAWE